MLYSVVETSFHNKVRILAEKNIINKKLKQNELVVSQAGLLVLGVLGACLLTRLKHIKPTRFHLSLLNAKSMNARIPGSFLYQDIYLPGAFTSDRWGS